MSSALKLEPRCPEPALFDRDQRIEPAHVRERAQPEIRIAFCLEDALEIRPRDEVEVRHVRRETLAGSPAGHRRARRRRRRRGRASRGSRTR